MISHTLAAATQQDTRQRVDMANGCGQRRARDTTKDVERWATETMMAPPPPPNPSSSSSSPVEEPSRPTSASSLPSSTSALPCRRNSASAGPWSTKLSAPPALPSSSTGESSSSSSRTLGASPPRQAAASSGCERRTHQRSPHSLYVEGLAGERPASMIVTSTTSSHALDTDAYADRCLTEHKIDAAAHPHLKSCLKTVAHVLAGGLDGIDEQQASPESPGSGMQAGHSTLGKSVHISENLPRHRHKDSASSSFDSSSSTSPLRVKSVARDGRLRRRSDVRRASDDHDAHSQNHSSSHPSPSLTTSTYGSEEDVPPLMTPMDEHGPSYEAVSTVETILSREKEQSERKAQLKILTNVRKVKRQAPQSALPTSASRPAAADTETSPDSDEIVSAAPILSRSTLLDLGLVKGTTTPSTSRGLPTPTDSIQRPSTISDSVVSVGLEMGLGVGMISSAISTVQSGSHFSRPGAPSYLNMDDVASALRQIDTEVPSSPLSHPTHHSEQVDSDLSREAVEHEEFELSRRRTTGGLRRDAPMRPIGRRRVQRGMGVQNDRTVGRPRQASELCRSTFRDAQDDYPSSFATTPIMEALSLHPATSPLNTPSHGTRGPSSPTRHRASINGGYVSGSHDFATSTEENGVSNKAEYRGQAFLGPQLTAAANLDGGFMGIGQCGHFGPGVRSKVAEAMQEFCDLIPLGGHEGETVNLVEYGSANSRSGLLFRPLISSLARRAHDGRLQGEMINKQVEPNDYFGNVRVHQDDPEATSSTTFCITHEDSAVSDLRPLMSMMETHPDSYMSQHWQAEHYPRLTDAIFSSYTMRPFAARIAPPGSVNVGMSIMDLHWLHLPRDGQEQTRSAKAHAELTGFLKARANEFKKDGILYVAYIARSDEVASPDGTPSFSTSPTASMRASIGSDGKTHSRASSLNLNRDIWMTLSNILAPCIQRLVSCGMLKTEVARHLLDLPLYPRTAAQSKAALRNASEHWKLEWSCGLGETGPVATTGGGEQPLHNEPQPLRLAHPAWTTYKSGCLASTPFSEHMTQLFKNLYEAHFRAVLRDKGAMSKGAVEFILDSLWDALFSRIADKEPHPISNVEIEVCVYALRRR